MLTIEPKVLEVCDLTVEFESSHGRVQAVSGLSYSLAQGQTIGVVGESGSGKSVAALAVLGLIPQPPGHVAGSRIFFEGEDLLRVSHRRLREIRGNRIAMIFQDPMTSLNPVFTIGRQISEVIRLHRRASRNEAWNEAASMLEKVGIPMPTERMSQYPHQLSGGMRQRVMIAMALACNPRVLLADEPTTALDVTIQAQIVALMKDLQRSLGTSIVLISHDTGLIAETCDRVIVMYAGRVLEEADVADLFSDALHPYTQGLLNSIPRLRRDRTQARQEWLQTIPGVVPSLAKLPSGCPFRTRCPKAFDLCSRQEPPFIEVSPGRRVRCWLHSPSIDLASPAA